MKAGLAQPQDLNEKYYIELHRFNVLAGNYHALPEMLRPQVKKPLALPAPLSPIKFPTLATENQRPSRDPTPPVKCEEAATEWVSNKYRASGLIESPITVSSTDLSPPVKRELAQSQTQGWIEELGDEDLTYYSLPLQISLSQSQPTCHDPFIRLMSRFIGSLLLLDRPSLNLQLTQYPPMSEAEQLQKDTTPVRCQPHSTPWFSKALFQMLVLQRREKVEMREAN